jgi:hypothetical protein
MKVRSSHLWLILSTVVAAALLVIAPGAQARDNVSLSLNVSFAATGAVTVTLPDGTPVGVTSGSPTLIPAGFYSLEFVQPGCTAVPMFTLKGPGVDIQEDLAGGELINDSADANFEPNSTYTWKIDTAPTIVHTFQTSNQVLGTPPPPAGAIIGQLDPYTGTKKATGGNTSVVGSAIAPFRGKLTGVVSSSGRMSIAFKGKGLANLKAGRYTVAVSDASRKVGFELKRAKHTPVVVTGVAFVGKHSLTVNLVAGKWLLTSGTGRSQAFVVK